jgi:glycosyltransferase involved in cell wall biosynthesis
MSSRLSVQPSRGDKGGRAVVAEADRRTWMLGARSSGCLTMAPVPDRRTGRSLRLVAATAMHLESGLPLQANAGTRVPADRGGGLSFCMITTFYPPYHFGGDAMYVHRLSNELARRGHSVTVVHNVDAYRAVGGRMEQAGTFANHPRVKIVALRSRLRAVSPTITYLTGRPGASARALGDVLRDGAFDVIHFHNISLIGGPGVLAYGSGLKLYTMHEHWLVCPMHVLWKDNRELCVEPSCFRCTVSFRRPPQLWRYTDLLERQLRHVDLFLAPSDFAAGEHARRGFRMPIRTLPYFVPTHERARSGESRPPTAEDRPYFLYVGRLERPKGLETLLRVFSAYDAADLVVVGDGNHAPALRRIAARLPHVRFLGWRDPAALRELYADALALLIPSLCYEVFGIVALEAFAQKTPVIARDRGALTSVVAESGGGILFRTDDELLRALESLRRDRWRSRELGALGHEAWLERWSDKPHLEGYFEAIREGYDRRARRTQSAPLHAAGIPLS